MNSVVDEIREEGRAMGIEEGKKENSRQTALRMIKLGKNTYEDIAVCTDLTLNEILKLADQLKDGSIASAKV